MQLADLRVFERRVRTLSRALKYWDAFRLVRSSRLPAAYAQPAFLKALKREIWLRAGTTDLNCVEKVFIQKEYAIPFPVEPKTIVDGGANIGLATVYFKQNYPDAKIVAIEPEARNFEILQKNCSTLPDVYLVNGAIWHKEEDVSITTEAAESWAFTVQPATSKDQATKIKGYRIDHLMEMFSLTHIDLLKLDIEGAELNLFASGYEHWLDKVNMIAIELHDRFVHGCTRAFFNALLGYDFHQEIRGENLFIRLK